MQGPNLKFSDVLKSANNFLNLYHPSSSLPIPIEELRKRLGRIPTMESPEILATVAQDLPEVFKVSDAVILRRLQKEGIVKFNS